MISSSNNGALSSSRATTRTPPRVERSSTEIVHSLFGTSVGRCWGDFSCSHYRQRGRMYAASNAIGFFSNLFGFERRILLHFQDVKDISAFRTTSIQVTTTEGEQYIFKSFENRELVVLLLLQLKQGHANGSTRHLADSDTDNDGENDVDTLGPLERSIDMSIDNGDDEIPKEDWKESYSTLETMPTTIQEESKQGPVSPGVMSEESATTDGAVAATSPPIPTATDGSEESPVEEGNMLENSTEILPQVSSQEQWERVKNSDDPPFNEISIDGLILPCTLDEFFALFLADNAPHSIDAYQRDSIGDSELTVSPWKTENDEFHSRVIKFRHPLPNGLGMGPPSALAERHQRFRRYDDFGFCLETSTSVKGVIASDCFYVDDKWLVEPTGETNVILTVKHQVRFTKRTMLKRVIQSTSNSEAQAWYTGYSRMLESSLKDKGSGEMRANGDLRKEENEASVASPTKSPGLLGGGRLYYAMVVASLFSVIVGIVFLLLQVATLQHKVASLENEVFLLRQDHITTFARLDDVVGHLKAVAEEVTRSSLEAAKTMTTVDT